ncbi:hypothetical protein JCM10212_002268 [Sporobolomyces blumeae]
MASSPILGTYVFKLHYDDGAVHHHRRYGYSGNLNLPQVFAGLYDRSTQVFSLKAGTFHLALRDSVGRPSIKLESFRNFVDHVCTPLVLAPDEVKIDEKGRRVLVFVVEKKEPAKPLTCTAQPPPRPVESTSPSEDHDSTIDYSSPSGEAKNKVDELSKRFEPVKTQPLCAKPAQPASRSGYNAAYVPVSSSVVEPSQDESVKAAAPASTTSGSLAAPPVAARDDKDKATPTKTEPWGTVRTMLETFVKDLNVHLADTFGDEAGSFRLRADEELGKGKEPEKVDEENKGQEKAKPEEKEKKSANRAIHAHVFCDRCLKTISGNRYKCRGCSNYDLCDHCVDFRGQFHPGAHAFVEIARPGSVPVFSPRGAIEVEAPQPAPAAAPVVAPTRAPEPVRILPAQAAPVSHRATCDSCQKKIIGVRHKCTDCPDYDLCEECFPTACDVHPSHRFVAIRNLHDYVWRNLATAGVVHRSVRCDGCNMSPIRGPRFKCVHPDCPDFDLCANCEADPIPRHPLDHHLLKMRQVPKAPFGVVPDIRAELHKAQELGRTVAHGAGANPLAAFLSSVGSAVASHVAPPAPVSPPRKEEKGVEADTGAQEDKSNEMKEVSNVPVAAAAVEDGEQPEEESSEDEAESASETEVGSAEENEQIVERTEARLGCAFVSDVTLTDGAVVPAGSEFCKVWKVENTGTVAWPASCRLAHVGGYGALKNEGDDATVVPVAQPGQVVEIQCECKAPEDDGRFMSFFRLEDPSGVKFGDRLWVDIAVQAEGTLGSSGSLSSSSIITPSLHAGGKSTSISEHGATTAKSASSVAPSTTFSLSEVESDFESVGRATGTGSHFSSRAQSVVTGANDSESQDEEDDDEQEVNSSSDESSELSEDSEDEFVVLSDEGDGWRHD